MFEMGIPILYHKRQKKRNPPKNGGKGQFNVPQKTTTGRGNLILYACLPIAL